MTDGKKKSFEEDPDRFVDMNDVIFMAVKRNEDGKSGIRYFINNGINSMFLRGVVFETIRQVIKYLDFEESKTIENRIYKPDNGKIIT